MVWLEGPGCPELPMLLVADGRAPPKGTMFMGPLVAEAIGFSSTGRILAGLGGAIWFCGDVGCWVEPSTPEVVVLEGAEPEWTVMSTLLMVLNC